MGLKDAVEKIVHNTEDAVSEAAHRVGAKVEELKRGVAGDEMSPGEQIGSAAKQTKEEVQAEIDHTKRDFRNLDNK